MIPDDSGFVPGAPLIPGLAHARCQVCVTIPARNEETSLPACLDALRDQVNLKGSSLPSESYEVLLLLNNCTDRSAEVAARWQQRNPSLTLHIVERTVPPEQAHVGTARRWLMDTAWLRLEEAVLRPTAILATDADTVTAPDWIAQNLRALTDGADVVGGLVSLLPKDLNSLPRAVRLRYERDRRYASLVARLEDALDPRPGDRCPRHLDHFGASLACTPEAYAAAGGMPAVSPLEDEAFIDQVRRAGCQLRHDPAVRVFTSARLQGRAAVGMAGQLRLWHELPNDEAHAVPSAASLQHRFRMLGQLRHIFETKMVGNFPLPSVWWQNTFAEALQNQRTTPDFLGAVYCNVLITETFDGESQEPIEQAIAALEALLADEGTARKSARRSGPVAESYGSEEGSGSAALSVVLQ